MPDVLYAAFDVVPSPKGASTHIMHFVRGLVNTGYTVHLITPGQGDLPASDTFEGARVTRVPTGGPGDHYLTRALAFSTAVAAHLETYHDYAVVHYRSIWGGLEMARGRHQYGYHTLCEVNGLPSIELKYHYPGLRETAFLEKVRAHELATLADSEAIICPSGVTRTYLTTLGVPRERITVIPNGVSPKEFVATPLPARTPDQVPTLLYIGTLADWQGLDLLIAALPSVLAVRPVHLRIVGLGRSRQRKLLAKHIRKLGLEAQVSVEGAVPHSDVPALIAASDICLAPLALNDRNVTQGCCPLKIIEYMACARPLLASNLPVVRELAREDVDALLFAPGDSADLARQLLRLLDDPALAARLAENAAAHVRARLTWHEAQKRLARVYAALLAQPTTARTPAS